MAHYRHEWLNDKTKWNYRFDIVPYGSDISPSTTALGAGVILPDGMQQSNQFSEIPMGLFDAPTFSFSLLWNRLPTALKTALENVTDGSGDRNLFLFWSDRGTGTWALEFCGTEEQIENTDFDSTDDNLDYIVQFNLIDAMYHAALTLKASDVFDSAVAAGVTMNYDNITEVGTPSYQRTDVFANALEYTTSTFNTDKYIAKVTTWETIAARIKTQLTTYLVTYLTRTTNGTAAAITNAADTLEYIEEYIDTGARFYKASTTAPRTKGASLTDSTALLITHIQGQTSGDVVGGMYAAGDDFSFAKHQSLFDVLKALAETLCVKVSWRPLYNTSGDGDYVNWRWDVATIFGNLRDDGTPSTLAMSTMVSKTKLLRGANAIAKTEVRITLDSNAQRNVTEWIYADARARGERSINVTPILHNVISWKDRWDTRRGTLLAYGSNVYQRGITQTNLICYEDTTNGINIEKAHETTRVVVVGVANGGTSTSFIEVSSAELAPLVGLDREQGQGVDTLPHDAALLQAWMNELQNTSCLPYALARTLYTAFHSSMQASIGITWRLNVDTVPRVLGSTHTITGNMPTTFASFNWARAVIVSVQTDWTNGTSEVSYFMPDLSEF